MAYRRSSFKSRRTFKRTARRINRRNLSGGRGGFRL